MSSVPGGRAHPALAAPAEKARIDTVTCASAPVAPPSGRWSRWSAPTVVALTAGAGVVGVFAETHAARPPSPPALGGYLLALAAAAMLSGRRRAPVVAAVGVVAVCLAYHLLGYPGLAPAVALYPALYSVVITGRRRRLLIAGALIVAVGIIPLLWPRPATLNPDALLGPEVWMVATAALAEAVRARRLTAEERLRSARQAAIDQERNRLAEQRLVIAREVHDVLAHTLAVITVQAAAAADALDTRPADTRSALVEVRRAAREATTELRGTLAVLRNGTESPHGTPAPTAPQPGLDQLPQLVERAGAAGLTVSLSITGDREPLTAAHELAVYRIVQEALTNTLRHGGATSSCVELTLGPEEIALAVTDHPSSAAGANLPPQTATIDAPLGAHGLAGMDERARALGGTLNAGRSPEGGFRVTARLPGPTGTHAPTGHAVPGSAAAARAAR